MCMRMSGLGTVKNRWLVVVGAVLIQLCLGAIYAWSVFTPDLIAVGWSRTQAMAPFFTGLAFFAIMMVFAGRLLSTVGPRKLTMLGGIVLGLGYAAAGTLNPTDFWHVTLLIGVVGGSGIGLAYVVPIAVGTAWFPDKKGLIMGLAVAGFGFGAMLWVKLAGAWGHLLETAGLGGTFLIYGVAFGTIVVLGSIWMQFPPEGWVPVGFTPPSASKAAGSGGLELSSGQMLRTPQFYIIFLTFVCGAGAGLMSIGLMKLFPIEALSSNGVDPAAASAIAGTAMAVFFSLANGLGRIVWGAFSDRIGRKKSLFIMMATQGMVLIAFPLMAGTTWLLYLGATLIGFNFGGNFSLFPSITADVFGNKHVGQNYPWVFLAYGVGGIGGPLMGGRLGDLGNFPLAFTICGVSVLIAATIIMAVHPVAAHVRSPKSKPNRKGKLTVAGT
jgi:OFA family oxalate/formate antiporter-like MFS transporter